MSGFGCVAAHTSDHHPTISVHRRDNPDETILVQLSTATTGETVVNIHASHPHNIRVNINGQEKL